MRLLPLFPARARTPAAGGRGYAWRAVRGPALSVAFSVLPALLWSSLSLGCLFGGEERVAGGGIRTTNGEVAGLIRFADATPAEGARIRLYGVFLSSDGIARQSVRTVVADAAGAYRFAGVPNGRYALTVTDDEAGTLAVMPRLVKADSGLAVLDVLLRPAITLRGRLLPAAGGPADPSAYQVCLPGLEACVTPGPDSVYTFPKAPQGECELIFIQGGTANYLTFQATRGGSDTVYVKDVEFLPAFAGTRYDYSFYATDLPRSLHVLPRLYPVGQAPSFYAGKVFDDIRYYWLTSQGKIEPWYIEDYMDWTHHQSVPLLTGLLSPSAAPQGLDFPYLVRLDSSNFDFSLADPRGLDIRFSSETNLRLDYHIATWSPATRFAEIWVRLDTLYGSNAPKAIWLHAGKKDVAGSQSFPYAVLNREAGYAPLEMKNLKRAVWYLDEKGGTAVLKDQREVFTSFLRKGAADLPAGSRSVPGVIGSALHLDGASEYIAIEPQATLDFPSVSLFLWAKNQSGIPAARQFLAAKGTADRLQWQWSVDSLGRLEFVIGDAVGRPGRSWKSLAALSGLDGWHHYAVTFGNGQARLYFDGRETAATATGTGPLAVPTSNGGMSLGVDAGRSGGFWRGDLDHFVYDSQVCSPDWVLLAYENQKPGP
jgi:hypothetical protein